MGALQAVGPRPGAEGPLPVAAFSAVVFFRGASCHPAVWLSLSYEGICLPGHWIHQCPAPGGSAPCQPHTGLGQPCRSKGP